MTGANGQAIKLDWGADSPARKVLLQWYKSLEESDRGGRARLRRCGSLSELRFEHSAYRFIAELRTGVGQAFSDREALPNYLFAIAGLSAHVKEIRMSPAEHEGGRPGRSRFALQLAEESHPGVGRPRFSESRFESLMRQSNLDEAYRDLVRAIAVLNGECDLPALAESLYWWNDRTRQQWAEAYYLKLESYPKSKKS